MHYLTHIHKTKSMNVLAFFVHVQENIDRYIYGHIVCAVNEGKAYVMKFRELNRFKNV